MARRRSRSRKTVKVLTRRLRRLEKRQDQVTAEVLHAVVHILEEYVPMEAVPMPKRKR